MRMECSTSKRRSKNLFKTALDKLVGKHEDNVYKVTVIYNNEGDNSQAYSNSPPAQSIIIDKKHAKDISRKENNIETESPKLPPRRKSRPSSQKSNKIFKTHNLFQNENVNVQNIKIQHNKSDDEQPKAPSRRRSRPSSQNSCKSYDLHDLSPRPTRPPRRRTYSQSSCKMISSNITSPTPISNHQANNFNCIDPYPNAKADCKYAINENMLKPPLPNPKNSIRKKINLSPQPVHIENTHDEDKPKSLDKPLTSAITANDSIKLDNPIDMTVYNALMDTKWAKVMESSSLSLNKLGGETKHETYLGHGNTTGMSDVHRTQSDHHLDKSMGTEHNQGQLTPNVRVKLSLERLDIPDWYKGRISKPELVGSNYKMPVWKKGSFANVQNISSKSSSSLPNPPSSPNPKCLKNIHNRSLSPSPILSNPPMKQPYTGWRSAEKQPTFLPIKI